jgi:hypothetical protein
VEKDLKIFGMSQTKRNLEMGPNIAILVIDMNPTFVGEIGLDICSQRRSQPDLVPVDLSS